MTISTWIRRAGLALVTSLALVAGASAAQAAGITLKVAVVHAQKQAGPDDPALDRIRGQLQKAFAGYKSFKQLDKREFKLLPGKKDSLKLPGNKSAEFAYQGPGGKGVHKVALKVGKNEFDLRIPERRLFFQAGLKHQGGMLVLAIYLR